MSHFDICLKQNKNVYIFKPFFDFFSTLPSTQAIKVIGLIFFYELALKNWAMNKHFNPIPIF